MMIWQDLQCFLSRDPSLLAFDERRFKGPHNLMTIYGMGSIFLDGLDPNDLQPLFKDAFLQLQRGKILEKMVIMEAAIPSISTVPDFFSSDSISFEACLERKNKKTGFITYHLQMVGAAIVHPDYKEGDCCASGEPSRNRTAKTKSRHRSEAKGGSLKDSGDTR